VCGTVAHDRQAIRGVLRPGSGAASGPTAPDCLFRGLSL